jgi:PAS domain S-box-containing protein
VEKEVPKVIPLEVADIVKVTNRVMASGFDLKQVAKGIATELRRCLGVDWMTLILPEDKDRPYRFISSESPPEWQEPLAGETVEKLEGFCEKAWETGLPILVSGGQTIDLLPNDVKLQQGTKSILFFPLRLDEKVYAILQLGSQQATFFSEDVLSTLRQLSTGLVLSVHHAVIHEKTKKRLDEQSILYGMAKVSTSSLGLDPMLNEIVNSLNPFFKFETWGIMLVEEGSKRLVPHASFVGLSQEEMRKTGSFMGRGVPGWVAEKGEPLLMNYIRRDSRSPECDERILSEMCVPLKTGEKVLGVIDARSKKSNAFSENDFHLFKMVGEHLAPMIESVRSEERYRSVVEGALDGVMVLSEEDRVTYVNERLAEILGYSKDELNGMEFRSCLDEESKPVLADRRGKRQRGEGVSPRVELNILRKDRRVRNVEMSSTVIKDSQGNANTVAFIKDITEKRRMEERLLQAEKLRAVGEMAGGVAHDFNNALAVILGNTQLLLSSVQDEDLTKSLKAIESEAQESAQTVRRLLEFTRKDGCEAVSEVDLNAVVKEAVETTQSKWKDDVQEKGVHIGLILNLEKVPPVAGVASELKEVIANMIVNATEAMPGGGRIEIRTFEREGVCIQISDSGMGMTEEVRKKIFEPFFTTQPFTHTGLGLSMSYGIVRRLGGGIEVESRVGEGATFTITLPVLARGSMDLAEGSMVESKGLSYFA